MPHGTVAAFDEQRGLGVITAEGREFPFHTTHILDGSRAISVGQAVEFEVGPGRQGDWEAIRIQKVGE